MLIGLDTNVVRCMVWGDLPELRERMLAAVESGKVRVPLTLPLQTELCGTARNPARYADVVALLRQLCRGLVLRPFDERIEMEAWNGRRLAHDQAFLEAPDTDAAFATLDDGAVAEQVATAFKAATQHQATHERGVPTDLGPLLGVDTNKAKALRDEFFADPLAAVTSWATDAHAELCERLGIQPRSRVSAELTPTLWFVNSYHLGRIRLLQLSQKGAKAEDIGDWGHAAEAAYVDRFVTDDRAFHEIMAWAPVPRDRFIRTSELARLLAADQG